MSTKVSIFGKCANKFATYWEKTAYNKIQRYEVAREFWALILGFVVLRLATSAVSIATGYSFFNVELSGVIESPTVRKLAGVTLLAVVEIITAAFLFKFFKFVFSARYALAGAMLAGVGVFYFVSFHTSTAGIRYYKTDTTSERVTIEQKATAGRDSIANYYDQQIADYRAMIEQILPPRWNDGKLTTGQQSSKTALYDKIANLQRERAAAFKEYADTIEREKFAVQTTANDDGERYYIYVVIIMLLQLSANGVLCFIYSRIYHEKNRPDEASGEVQQFCSEVADDTNNLIRQQVAQQYGDYLRGVGRALQTLKSFAVQTPDVNVAPVSLSSKGATPSIGGGASTAAPEPIAAPEPPSAAPEPNTHKKIIVTGFVGGSDSGDDTSTTDTIRGGGASGTATPEPSATYENRKYENRKYDSIARGVAVCPICGAQFVKNHHKQVYCSDVCKYQNHANKHGKPYKFGGVWYYPQTS